MDRSQQANLSRWFDILEENQRAALNDAWLEQLIQTVLSEVNSMTHPSAEQIANAILPRLRALDIARPNPMVKPEPLFSFFLQTESDSISGLPGPEFGDWIGELLQTDSYFEMRSKYQEITQKLQETNEAQSPGPYSESFLKRYKANHERSKAALLQFGKWARLDRNVSDPYAQSIFGSFSQAKDYSEFLDEKERENLTNSFWILKQTLPSTDTTLIRTLTQNKTASREQILKWIEEAMNQAKNTGVALQKDLINRTSLQSLRSLILSLDIDRTLSKTLPECRSFFEKAIQYQEYSSPIERAIEPYVGTPFIAMTTAMIGTQVLKWATKRWLKPLSPIMTSISSSSAFIEAEKLVGIIFVADMGYRAWNTFGPTQDRSEVQQLLYGSRIFEVPWLQYLNLTQGELLYRQQKFILFTYDVGLMAGLIAGVAAVKWFKRMSRLTWMEIEGGTKIKVKNFQADLSSFSTLRLKPGDWASLEVPEIKNLETAGTPSQKRALSLLSRRSPTERWSVQDFKRAFPSEGSSELNFQLLTPELPESGKSP